MLLVVSFQGWPFGTGEPVGVIFLGRATSPGFTQLTVVLCVELRPLGLFWIQFGMFIVSSLFSSCLGDHVGETLLLGDRMSQHSLRPSDSYSLSAPSSTVFPERQSFVVVSIVSIRTDSTTLRIYWLWFSVVVSIHCKGKFPWWRQRLHFFVGIRTNVCLFFGIMLV